MVPMTPDIIAHMNRLTKDDKAHTDIDAPYYVYGRALTESAPADSRELHHAAPSTQTLEPPSVDIEMIRESDETDPNTVELPTALDISPAVPTLQTAENSIINNDATDEQTEPNTEATEEHIELINTEAPPDLIEEPDNLSTTQNAASPIGVRKYPSRERKPPSRLNLHMTAKRALKEDPATARPAIEAELKTLVSKGVFRPYLDTDGVTEEGYHKIPT